MNRTEIVAAARERLHRRLLIELDEAGLDGIDLPAILERVAISRAEFDATYDSLSDALFGAYEEWTSHLDEVVRAACRGADRESDWPVRVRLGLEALLRELAAEPQLARVLARAFPATSPRAQARTQAFVESFAPMLAPGRRLAPEGVELPVEVEVLAGGGAEAIIFDEIVAGRAGDLPKLLPSLVFSLLVPFVGPTEASAEMKKAQG